MIDLPRLLQEKQIVTYLNQGVPIARVLTMYEGFKLARDLLLSVVDRRTVLYLSGGRTPKDLYANLANDQKLQPGAVALIDERYGIKGHQLSNEKMIEESKLQPYVASLGVPFYPILQASHPSLQETADNYDMTVRYLFAGFPQSVGILGIGLDGHTAGIAGNRPADPTRAGHGFENPMFDLEEKKLLVSSYSDLQGPFKERVSMTFLGLSMLDVFVVLVFGQDKKEALRKVFLDGAEEEIPGRFFKRPEIAKRTLIITDLKI